MTAITAQPVGSGQSSSGIAGLGFWRYRTEITTPPGSGQLRFDNADPTLATEFYLHETNDAGSDVSAFLALIDSGAVAYIQLQSDSGRHLIIEVGLPVDSGVYYTFPITQIVRDGAAFGQNSSVGFFVTASLTASGNSLQTAYNLAPAPPQISVNAGQPLTIDLAVAANDVFAVRNSVNADILRISDTRWTATIPTTITGIPSLDQTSLRFDDTFTTGGAYIGGALASVGAVTYNSSTSIFATFTESKTYNAAVGPGFAAYTVMNVLPRVVNSGNFNLVNIVGVNMGGVHRRGTAGTSVAAQTLGFSFASQVQAGVAGAVMTRTLQIGLAMSPTYSTVAGSTANLGTIIGLQMNNPAVGLFQPGAGVETLAGYYGLIMNAIPFGGNVPKAAVQSALLSASNAYFLRNVGTAHSDFGTSHIYFNDNFGVALGGVGTGAFDVWITWNSAGYMRTFFNPIGDELRLSAPSADRFLLTSNVPASNEYDLDFSRFNFGSAGAIGNQAFNFTQKARTITVGGGYASALFTAGGNLNLGVLGMSDVSSWVVNALSFDNTAYTITELATLKVGGMTISNPGGTVTERAGAWFTGRLMQRGAVQYPPINPAALSAGNNNDWAGLLTGSPNNATRRWARITGAATATLTGIDATAVQDGDTHELTNVGANTIAVTNQDAASAAANRIDLGSWSGTLTVDDSVTLRYDLTSAFWRVVGSQIG